MSQISGKLNNVTKSVSVTVSLTDAYILYKLHAPELEVIFQKFIFHNSNTLYRHYDYEYALSALKLYISILLVNTNLLF